MPNNQNPVQTRSKASDSPAVNEDQFGKIVKYMDKKMEEFKQQVFAKIELESSTLKKNLESELSDMKKSIEFIGQQYDEITNNIGNMLQLKKNVDVLENANSIKDLKIKNLEIRLAYMEQQNISYNCAELSGVETLKNENSVETVERFIKKFDIQIEPGKINKVIQYPDKSTNQPGAQRMIIHFIDEKSQSEFLNARKSIKQLKDRNIFIGEVLSSYSKSLLWKTKQKAKEAKFQFVWFRNNKICVKKNPELSSRVLIVKHEDDLNLLS